MIKINDVFAIEVNENQFNFFTNWKEEKDGKYYICPSEYWWLKDNMLCYEEDGKLIEIETAYYMDDLSIVDVEDCRL